jgi:hypothetical protein
MISPKAFCLLAQLLQGETLVLALWGQGRRQWHNP